MIDNLMSRKWIQTFIFLILLLPVSLFSWTTNFNVEVGLPTQVIGFLQIGNLVYSDPQADQILSVQTTNFPFLRYSLDIRVSNLVSNQAFITFKCYETSNFIFPPLLFTTTKGMMTNTYYTPPLILPGTNLGGKVEQPGPLLDIFPLNSWIWLWIVAGALVLGTALFFLMRRRRKIKQAESRAMDPFQNLENSLSTLPIDQLETGQYRPYFEMISESIRRFLENTLHINAMEFSTREIRFSLQEIQLDQSTQDIVRHILSLCDRVKYAKHEPEFSQVRTLLEESISLMFHVAPRLGHPYDHGLSHLQRLFQDLEAGLGEKLPDDQFRENVRQLISGYLHDFYFLSPKVEINDFIELPEKFSDNYTTILKALESDQIKNKDFRDSLYERSLDFYKSLSSHYGYIPFEKNVPSAGNGKEA